MLLHYLLLWEPVRQIEKPVIIFLLILQTGRRFMQTPNFDACKRNLDIVRRDTRLAQKFHIKKTLNIEYHLSIAHILALIHVAQVRSVSRTT